MKYKLIKYIGGEQVGSFETDDLKEAQRWYESSDFLGNCAIRVFIDGRKLTYGESDKLMSSKQRRRRLPGFRRVDHGKKTNQHLYG